MAGRNPKYHNDELLKQLQIYINKNPNKKIKLSDLAKATGVSYNIWKFNSNIREVIDKINNPPISTPIDNLNFTLPNAEQLVNVHYGNKVKLVEAIQDCFDIISELYDYAIDGFKVAERDKVYQNEINNYKVKIVQLENEILSLNREIDMLYIDSNSPLKRNQKGLKSNLIELTPKHIKAISKDPKELENEYKDLFD